MRRLIIFLVRKKLKLKKNQRFQFTNQKSSAEYYFTNDRILKDFGGYITESSVSLNWLLNDECKIVRKK